MSRKQRRGKLIGGFGAAVLLGLCGIFQKLAVDGGASATQYVALGGLGIILRGIVPMLLNPEERKGSIQAILLALCGGLFWGSASCLMGYAIIKYASPISLLSPLSNLNTVIAVFAGYMLFSEKVYWNRVIVGTILAVFTGFILTTFGKDQSTADYNMGLVWGGLVAGYLYGLFGVFLKLSFNAGIAGSHYLVWTGVGISLVGLVVTPFMEQVVPPDKFQADNYSAMAATLWALVSGIVWGTACHCIGLAVEKYKTPLAVLAPLYNLNTIVTVSAGVLLFGETVPWHILVSGTGLTLLSGYILVKSQIPEDDTTQFQSLKPLKE